MLNSRHYGPCQVRDLSESWSDGASDIRVGRALMSGASNIQKHQCTPEAEVQASVRERFLSKVQSQRSIPRSTLALDGSHTVASVWKGARFSRVRGSIPPAIITGSHFSPGYISAEVRRLNTVAS